MMRTQIQLTKAQAAALKRLAATENVSIAELIRRSIDHTLDTARTISLADRRRRALGIIGAFASGQRDLAQRHDDALAEAYR
jgi:hypothetical protein